MIKEDAIFQRTQTGRDEIHNKLHGLTQSERRTLIVVDGRTSYANLCVKMSGLPAHRIERALQTLLQRGLIYEVLMPMLDQESDQLDGTVVERFLRQELHDPLTILAFDEEDELEELEDMFKRALPEVSEALRRRQRSCNPTSVFPITAGYARRSQGDNGREGKLRPVTETRRPKASSRPSVKGARPGVSARRHWGYWMVSAGVCLMSISLLTKALL